MVSENPRDTLVRPGQVAEVPVDEPPADLCLGDVNEILGKPVSTRVGVFVHTFTYTLHGVVEVAGLDNVAVQQTALGPPYLPAPLLVDEQPAPQLLGLNLEEARELLQIHGGVELEVALDRGRHHVVLDLVHEDAQVVLDGVNVDLWVVKVGRRGADELGAGAAEQLLEERKRVGPAALQPVKLLAVLLPQGRVDGVVEAGGVEGDADGDEGVHLVVLLGDGVVLGVLLEVLCARDVDEDVAEHADGVRVAAHHHVREADVVVRGEVGGHDTGKHGLFVQLNVVERLEGEAKVSEQAVDAQQADDGKVSQHLVQRAVAVLAGVQAGVLAALHGRELLADLRALDERVEDVEDAVAAPCVWVLAQQGNLLFVVALLGDALAVAAEAVELVDELVDDVPGPVVLSAELARLHAHGHGVGGGGGGVLSYVWHLEVDGALGVEDVVEQVAVAVVAGELCLERGLELERRGGGLQLGVDVLVARHRGHAVEVLHAVVLHLLAVVVGHGLLLDVRVVVRGAPGGLAILVLRRHTLAQTHDGCGAGRVVAVVGVVLVVGVLLPRLRICKFGPSVRFA